jgi:hypothetical protein
LVLSILEVTSFVAILALGATGVTFPLSLPWNIVAAPALLVLVGGPLYLALWLVGLRTKEARRVRDAAAMLIAFVHAFLTAGTVVVFLVAPISG